ncbi:endonuclease exonuclease phosphatase domain containing protein [Plakobranchus ocellatus]|uniref:Endonuclease exonuclease phosphatase domain containing protein n=1 Tax=Plakobranchus ocellatus TaxID=259542 RepID=A0AAV4CSV7_9GAST|nr:endonuclease exonuclease phosphatase domain containing protein [Plakobranchus ocellatus]
MRLALYPYGVAAGDSVLERSSRPGWNWFTDYISDRISFSTSVPFGRNRMESAYVSLPYPNPNLSFSRDSRVQQVSPYRHPTSACKININQTLKIATWNLCTLHQKRKLENVIKEMDRIKYNILELAEVRWTGKGSTKLGIKTLIYSGGHTHQRGIGILFDVTTARSLGSWCPISKRVVVAKLVAKSLNLGIFQVYALTSDSEDVEEEVL